MLVSRGGPSLDKGEPAMRWMLIRSLMMAAGCLGTAIAIDATAAPRVKTPRVPAVAPVEEAADEEEQSPRAAGDESEPAPLPDAELEAADDESLPSSEEASASEAASPDSEEMSEDESPATEAAAKDKEDAEDEAEKLQPVAEEDADEALAPPPPGGTLLDKIKKAAVATPRPEPAVFHGLRVGKSTTAQVDKAFGKPLTIVPQKEIVRRTYRLDGASRVEVRCLRDVVQAIIVNYEPQPHWTKLAAEVGMENIEPVDVTDERGDVVGIALPEAGALAVYAAEGKQRIAELVFERVDAQAFTLRAEQRLDYDDTGCQQDLDMALVVDPQCARAHWLRARVLRTVGQLDAATKAIELAVKIDPRNPRYRLTASVLLADEGQYAKAIEQTKQALKLSAARPELKACAMNQLGDQMAAGPGRDYKQALPLHLEAIKLVEPLAHDRRPVVRRLAQESLIVAHLSAARNIAWGNWKMKKKMVPSWLNRAEELAAETAPGNDAPVDMRLRVCREALAACVGMEGDLDPTPWAEKALALAAPAIEIAKDPLRKRQLEWELGSALYDALQVFHTTGDTDQAMKYGTLAVEHLEAGAEGRQLEPVEAYLLGRLYFRMGAVCALHIRDPEQAITWFERAIPLLERPVPAAALTEAGRHGESFVSMAVSYWAVGSHEEAVRLTRDGLKLMEQAVKTGTLDEDALRVPYTNLATMHRFLGDDEQADAFTTMATKTNDTKRK
jgi:tetratricopeptide (TPR) repeat protein